MQCLLCGYSDRSLRADPVSNRNVTGTLFIVTAIEKEELRLAIDIIGLHKLQV